MTPGYSMWSVRGVDSMVRLFRNTLTPFSGPRDPFRSFSRLSGSECAFACGVPESGTLYRTPPPHPPRDEQGRFRPWGRERKPTGVRTRHGIVSSTLGTGVRDVGSDGGRDDVPTGGKTVGWTVSGETEPFWVTLRKGSDWKEDHRRRGKVEGKGVP